MTMTNAEKLRRYAEQHPDKVHEAQRRYREKNRDKIHARQKEYDARRRTPERLAMKRARTRATQQNYLDTEHFKWEDVEGYDGFTVNVSVHHRLELYGYPRKRLKELGWYKNCCPDELICLSHSEHAKLHHLIQRRFK